MHKGKSGLNIAVLHPDFRQGLVEKKNIHGGAEENIRLLPEAAIPEIYIYFFYLLKKQN